MDDNAPQSGQLSDDGQWAWTGDQWVPANTATMPDDSSGYYGQATEAISDGAYGADQASLLGQDPSAFYGQDPATTYPQSYGQDPAATYPQSYGQDPATTYPQSYGQDPTTYPQSYGQTSGSPESGWRWDGAQWVPVTPSAMPPPAAPAGRKKLSPVIVAALVAALVIVALLIVWTLTRGSGTEPVVAPTTPAVTTSSAPEESESPTDEASPTFDESESPDPDSVFGSESAVPDPLAPSGIATGPLTVDQAAALVDWTRFSAGTQERVDSAAAAGDCATLQSLRETASANDATVQAATGLGTADLVNYIDAQERAVGCTVAPAP